MVTPLVEAIQPISLDERLRIYQARRDTLEDAELLLMDGLCVTVAFSRMNSQIHGEDTYLFENINHSGDKYVISTQDLITLGLTAADIEKRGIIRLTQEQAKQLRQQTIQ